MHPSHATSIQKVDRDEASPTASSYERGKTVLRDSAFLNRKTFQLRSKLNIWLSAFATGALVFIFALGLQWTIYDRFLHESGIRVVGSAIAAAIAVGLIVTLGFLSRSQRKQEIERLKTIALLNHHIRNALQAIVSCTGDSDSTDVIRGSVERIEWALGEVLPELSRQPEKQPSSRSKTEFSAS